VNQFASTDFHKVYELIISAGPGLPFWIEHYFIPPGCLAELFLGWFTQNLRITEAFPLPFFVFLYKAMRVHNSFDVDSLFRLFNAVAQAKSDSILKATAKFLIWLRLSLPMATIHKVAFGFLNFLDPSRRLAVFDHIVSDLPFLLSITKLTIDVRERLLSPYNKLLSLFFMTLNYIFMENENGQLRKCARTLSLLGATLEQYVDAQLSKNMARCLFPILQMLFTFFDSISITLKADVHVISPVLLFFFKYGDRQHFCLYFELLSYDNQLRFFDFLIAVSSERIIDRIAAATLLPPVNACYEISRRILIFLSFMSQHDTRDRGILEKLFDLLSSLLQARH
jgi:hypothetical protein